ncbi:hypothetical protein BKA56DRAFT_26907 [Ilyonectria sp. MPI-CAGE-AT-0026]|nr:hypothetical protein BKA56DRAFT_26907 [Ilyonectria sp. MPI-CAGE-AT-0026]
MGRMIRRQAMRLETGQTPKTKHFVPRLSSHTPALIGGSRILEPTDQREKEKQSCTYVRACVRASVRSTQTSRCHCGQRYGDTITAERHGPGEVHTNLCPLACSLARPLFSQLSAIRYLLSPSALERLAQAPLRTHLRRALGHKPTNQPRSNEKHFFPRCLSFHLNMCTEGIPQPLPRNVGSSSCELTAAHAPCALYTGYYHRRAIMIDFTSFLLTVHGASR